ncbi:HAD family hydrolase [Amycolatopsis sp. CA-230715]|uniref:HAD family hydrolase n=1 Tax=Amycolatopsis sp. CA-230715 TaxID=2745196 RepID=UPI001C02935E|nr:HAD family hydrolase [Amycolatopsis sp. CA-230715]QWF78686.1 hypothetical protein HUW46_02084 [Amycolatopsis sp. CA-230715]
MTGRVNLITIDIGNTLGEFTGRSTTDRLRELSRLNEIAPHRTVEAVRALLHRAPELTEDLVCQVCQRLLIPYDLFPANWGRGYVPYPDASATLAGLREVAPLVALSNMAVTGGPERVAAVRAAHGDELEEVYPSYRLGGAKPEPWLWQMIADRRGVNVSDVVHIGDRLDADVYGPFFAGARAVHLRKEGSTVYPPFSGDHIRTVFRLSDAVQVVRGWAELRA